MRARRAALGMVILTTTAWTVTPAPVSAGLPRELPVFDVVKAGLTSDEAGRLSRAFDVDAHYADGSVRFVSKAFNDVPMLDKAPVIGKDEGGRRTAASFFDLRSIRAIKPVPDAEALDLVGRAFNQADIQMPEGAKPTVGHTELRFKPRGKPEFGAQIATSVRYELSLAGRRLIGPGADIGATLDPNGVVTDLREAAFIVQQGKTMPLIPQDAATAECLQRYPRGSRVSLGLLYYAPPVSGDVQQLLPYYECRGRGPGGSALVSALVPAIAETVPTVRIEAALDATTATVNARVHIAGGTRPYRVQWISSTGSLAGRPTARKALSYELDGRSRSPREDLMVVVTDANGVTGQASRTMALPRSVRGHVQSGARAVSPASVSVLDVGAEFNVTNWTCVQQSAAGFQSEFASRGYSIAFRWLAPNAWERDFRDTATKAGDDSSYVDNVDLAWYTGHGSTGSFTFDNAAHDDGNIVPSDARWGDRDLEWLQLESCNVLQFTDGAGTPIWSRWSQVFDGLHLLNGFQTTASCVTVGGGTAGEFSSWLLGKSFGFFSFPALRVRQAWAMMALSLEPPGKQYVTMGVYGAGGVTNYDDYFWGKGAVGPDIPKSQITGYWWLMGTV